MWKCVRALMLSLALAVIHAGNALGQENPEEAWSVVKSEKLVLRPGICSMFEFYIPEGSEYRVSIQPENPSQACSTERGIRWTVTPYESGHCLQDEESSSIWECKTPGPNGIQEGQDLCKNWEELDTSWLTATDGGCDDGIEGSLSICSNPKQFFMALMSMSNKHQTVQIMIGITGGVIGCCCYCCPGCPGHTVRMQQLQRTNPPIGVPMQVV